MAEASSSAPPPSKGASEEEPVLASALRAATQASVGVAATVVGWSALKAATGADAADMARVFFVNETVVRLLFGSPADGGTSSTYRFDDHSRRSTRAALSVCVWVPAFSGALFSIAKGFLQLNERDTVASARRRESCTMQKPPSPRPETSSAGASKPKPTNPFSAEAPPSVNTASGERGASPSVAASAARAVPKIRLGSVARSPLDAGPGGNTDEESPSQHSSPPSAALRAPDSVSLAVTNTCSLLDINALLTAAAKYGVGQVVVPHGSQRRDAQGRVNFGLTPRPGSVSDAPSPSLAHVTSRTLEFIGRFQRTVHLAEVDPGVELPDFLDANRADLNTSQQPLVTVAVHRHMVAGATYMRDFEHPVNAVYVFAKETASPTGRPGYNNATPAAAPLRGPAPPFASPLKVDGTPARGGTFEAHAAAAAATPTRLDSLDSTELSVCEPVPQEFAFCQRHVYLRDDGRQTLAAVVNVTLYDRAVKMRRAALE